jgi:hypothetical protein
MRPETIVQHIKRLFGIYTLKCRACRAHSSLAIFSWRAITRPHCPNCFRYELTRWSEPYSRVSRWTRWKVKLGAAAYRCEFCRVNLASFRRAEHLYTYREYEEMRRQLVADDDQLAKRPQRPQYYR